ncbi:alpha-glucosidase [Cordyceps militaris CM01]|uniref:Alpha-glucosidase n=1 Tax=Cordyceps militaris (strain CM01) TaxID=983644 RepID=G3JKU8_CORMM|nr:alpha-glucosidase [Cordyceps militaris CM01]EGX90322.1 alpha-glucosidase [Cordyceps militaris CM01]
MRLWGTLILPGLASAAGVMARADTGILDKCPGYTASNVQITDSGLTASLSLAGTACNVYGDDIQDLVLQVTYETDNRLHVKIQDAANQVYQVPSSVFARSSSTSRASASQLRFTHTTAPFSFAVARRDTGEVLFDTAAAALVFETQYLRLRTALPADPYLYGLGEHSDPFRLNTTAYVRTLWNQDSFGIPNGANLYGAHPFYLEQRAAGGAHGVLLLNSNGMDIVVDQNPATGQQYLEYNTLGGVLDLYFFAGPQPVDVARQYGALAGTPAMPPYWGLGYHNCRYGYQDAFEVAEVVHNYSAAGIPLETMWTDIDYMDRRRVFSLDPERYPLATMRALVTHLHGRDQHYVVMVDPAVAYQDYPPLRRGLEQNAFLLRANGSAWVGVVWPGVAVFPDWFAETADSYWTNEFRLFFDKDDGVDIDALWIDMNEPSNFPCNFPCDDPYAAAEGYPPPAPPVRATPRSLPGWPCEFQTGGCTSKRDAAGTILVQTSNRNVAPFVNTDRLILPARAAGGDQKGLPGRDLLFPKYAIHNKAAYRDDWNADRGGLSNHTVNTDVRHQNGLSMYDTHNMYGALMSTASHAAMLARRPGLRPLIITRSTFAGAGRTVGHWLGDNVSTWQKYRESIRGMLAFTALFQFNMVGSDVCGFAGTATEELCARWASLGAFYSFYRNHNEYGTPGQEFYRWESVTAAAKKAIDIRYRLMDYFYTAMQRASEDGTPSIAPVFYHYPADQAAWALELQYFYGPAIMVAPVTEEGATSVDVYLPEDKYYDWYTHQVIRGGRTHTFADVDVTTIPLLIRGGVVIPLRVKSANTTTELRKQDFELLVPLDENGTAAGELYVDDGVSVTQKPGGVTDVQFKYEKGVLSISGTFAVDALPRITKVTVLGEGCKTKHAAVAGASEDGRRSRSVNVDISLNVASTINI